MKKAEDEEEEDFDTVDEDKEEVITAVTAEFHSGKANSTWFSCAAFFDLCLLTLGFFLRRKNLKLWPCLGL